MIKYKRYEVSAEGKCEQNGIGTPDNPINIICNNGIIKARSNNNNIEIYTEGTVETITDSENNIATCENLLSVNSYKDIQNITNGTITRNVGILVLKGNESNLSPYQYGTNSYEIKNISKSLSVSSNDNNILTFCTHFKTVSMANRAVEQGQLCYLRDYKCIVFRNTQFTSLENFKTFLSEQYNAGTPVIVVYPLENSTTELVTGQKLVKGNLTVNGSIANLTISANDVINTLKRRYITDNNGVLQEVKNIYISDNPVFGEISVLPRGWTKLEYISSTSSGAQYIDLGIKLYEIENNTYDIAIKFNLKGSGYDNPAMPTMFGCQKDVSPYPGTFIRKRESSNQVQCRYIGSSSKDSYPGTLNQVLEFPTPASGSKNVYTSVESNTHNWGTSLFCYFSDDSNTPTRYAEADLYYFRLWLNNTLVRDLIPCKDTNNVVGMYDIVNNVFYTSPNGTAFAAGPEV